MSQNKERPAHSNKPPLQHTHTLSLNYPQHTDNYDIEDITLTFARFCDKAALIQNPCGERHIWQTIPLDELCEDCGELYHQAQQAQGRRRR